MTRSVGKLWWLAPPNVEPEMRLYARMLIETMNLRYLVLYQMYRQCQSLIFKFKIEKCIKLNLAKAGKVSVLEAVRGNDMLECRDCRQEASGALSDGLDMSTLQMEAASIPSTISTLLLVVLPRHLDYIPSIIMVLALLSTRPSPLSALQVPQYMSGPM
jgi:hypothetical protein